MKNRERTIEFSKTNLTKLAKNNYVGWYFAKGIEGLCLYHGKQKKSFTYNTELLLLARMVGSIELTERKLGDINEPISK